MSRLVPQHDQGTVHRGNVHWLPVAVQHESRSLQHTATHECDLSDRCERLRGSSPWPESGKSPRGSVS